MAHPRRARTRRASRQTTSSHASAWSARSASSFCQRRGRPWSCEPLRAASLASGLGMFVPEGPGCCHFSENQCQAEDDHPACLPGR